MKLLLHWYIYVYRSWDKWWRSWWICCTHHERSALTNIFPPPSHPSCTLIGAHPISKLDVMDSKLSTDISVYAYPCYRFNDMNTSATPAVAFTAVIHNSLSETQHLYPFQPTPWNGSTHTVICGADVPFSNVLSKPICETVYCSNCTWMLWIL